MPNPHTVNPGLARGTGDTPDRAPPSVSPLAILKIAGRNRTQANTKRRSRGFTLVEVIVAMAILSLTLAVLLNVITNAIRQSGDGEKLAQAGALAQSLLAKLGTELPIRETRDSGQSPNGLRWRLSLQRFGDVADQRQWPVGAYRVSVEIHWGEGGRERLLGLTSLRLAPKEDAR
jgi:general secretion pathway protein I